MALFQTRTFGFCLLLRFGKSAKDTCLNGTELLLNFFIEPAHFFSSSLIFWLCFGFVLSLGYCLLDVRNGNFPWLARHRSLVSTVLGVFGVGTSCGSWWGLVSTVWELTILALKIGRPSHFESFLSVVFYNVLPYIWNAYPDCITFVATNVKQSG